MFGRVGLPEPRTTLYELRVEVRDLLARAFPNAGDEIEIVKTFRASAADGRLGIPIHLHGDNVHVTYRAAILIACASVRFCNSPLALVIGSSVRGKQRDSQACLDVRFWHKADMSAALSDVCFWGKADIPCASRNVS